MPLSEGDVLRRLTSISLIAGGLLMLVISGPASHERAMSGFLLIAAGGPQDGTLGSAAGLVGAAAVWAVVGGFSNVHHFLRLGSAAAWSRLGWYTLVTGSAGLTVAYGLSIGALSANASGLAEDTSASRSLELASGAVGELSAICFWMALAVISVGMTRNRVYPARISWSLMAIATVSASFSLAALVTDFDTSEVVGLAVRIVPMSAWSVVSGAWLLKVGWRPDPAPE